MNEEQATYAVRDSKRVRLRYAQGDTRAEGRAVAFSITPMVLIETDDGEQVWWRHDMAELVQEPTS